MSASGRSPSLFEREGGVNLKSDNKYFSLHKVELTLPYFEFFCLT